MINKIIISNLQEKNIESIIFFGILRGMKIAYKLINFPKTQYIELIL